MVIHAKNFVFGVAAAALWVAAGPGAASAQEPGQSQRRVETINVSATRLPVRASDLPGAVRAWSAEQLQDSPAIVLDEALRAVPAFSLFRRTSSRDSHPTAQGLNLRGVGPSGVSRALVLVDGVPMNDPFGGWVYWDRVPLLAIEQVELSLGGGSAPYGSQALGGVLQLVTRKRMESNLQLQAMGGTDSTVRFGVAAGGEFEGGSVLASAHLFNTAGYIATAPEERGSVDTPIGVNSQAARLRIDLGSFTANLAASHEFRNNGTPLQENETTFGGVSIAWSGTTSSGNRGWNAYGFGRSQVFSSTFSSVAPDRNSERLVLLQRVPSTDFGAGALGWAAWGGNKRASFGGDWRRVDGHSKETVIFNGATRAPGGIQNSGGGFAAADWDVSAQWSISAGLRADAWRQQPVKTAGETSGAATLSPRIGVAYRPAESGLTVRGAAYRAFRAPTLNELYRQFRVGNVTTLPNPDLEQEKLWGAEAGGGWEGPLGSSILLRVDTSFYWNRLADAIVNATQSVAPNRIIRRRENLGAATVRGAELDARLEVRTAWSISVAYAWLNSIIRDATDGSEPSLTEGNRLPQVPTYRVRSTLGYQGSNGWAGALSVGGVGEQFEDDLNLLRLAPAITVDASVEIPLIDAARITVRAENLFDARVEAKRTPTLAYAAPRLVYAGVTLTWPD